MKSQVESTFFRNRLAELQREVDDQFARDGDQLKHARASDILRAVRTAFKQAQELGRV